VSFFRDKVAPAMYDFLLRRSADEFDPQREALLAGARGRVLEVGAGTGWNLRFYPPEVEEIVATEPEAGMLGRTRQRAEELDRPVRFVEAKAEQLPFEDDEFDTVVSTLVLCTVEDQDRALAEIHRVLKPGGRFLFIEHVRSEDPKRARWQDRLERPWKVLNMGCHPNRRTLASIERAGFQVEDLERGTLPKAPPIVRPMIAGSATRS
jgi:ubiquinone/menaquinone biosynthesis C-methylase UbiE